MLWLRSLAWAVQLRYLVFDFLFEDHKKIYYCFAFAANGALLLFAVGYKELFIILSFIYICWLLFEPDLA